MGNPAGIRMRMSFAALIVGVAASLTVIGLIAVDGCATPKTWLAAEVMVWPATGDTDAAMPSRARRRTPGSRIWIFMVRSAGASAVPQQLQRIRYDFAATWLRLGPGRGSDRHRLGTREVTRKPDGTARHRLLKRSRRGARRSRPPSPNHP